MRHLRRFFPPLFFIWPLLGIVFLAAIYYMVVGYAFTFLRQSFDWEHEMISNWGDEATIINGLVLGLLLSIRYHKLFDRWWEARTVWGVMVNDIRNLTLKLDTYCELTPEEERRYANNLTEFVQVLAAHLREESHPGEEHDLQHPPSRSVKKLYQQVHELRAADRMSFESFLALDQHLSGLLNACGASERIMQTQLPYSYYALLRQGITIYLLATPCYLYLEMMEAGLFIYLILVYFLVGGEMALSQLERLFHSNDDGIKSQLIADRLESYLQDVMIDLPAKRRE